MFSFQQKKLQDLQRIREIWSINRKKWAVEAAIESSKTLDLMDKDFKIVEEQKTRHLENKV